MPRENLVLGLRGVASGDGRGPVADVSEGDVALDAGPDLESVESSADGLNVERPLLDRHENRLGLGTAPSQRGQRVACPLPEDPDTEGAEFATRVLLDLRLACRQGSDNPNIHDGTACHLSE